MGVWVRDFSQSRYLSTEGEILLDGVFIRVHESKYANWQGCKSTGNIGLLAKTLGEIF